MADYKLPEEDISQYMVAEAMHTWGGRWTEEKLDAFEKYVHAYLTIMNKNREKYNWKLLYFDAFAGSGSRVVADSEEKPLMQALFQSEFLEEGQMDVYQGAAERVVRMNDLQGFDWYYFVDLDKESNEMLRNKLAPFETEGRKFVFRNTDANSIVKEMGRFLSLHSSWKALVLLDPFGMNLDWSTIESLKGAGVDLWILVPSGMIINRLLERDGSLKHIERLKSYFGIPKDEIEKVFYRKRISEPDLFGERHEFHFVCASHNQTAVKIAQDIIRKKQD